MAMAGASCCMVKDREDFNSFQRGLISDGKNFDYYYIILNTGICSFYLEV
jgi:hypothetical protein